MKGKCQKIDAEEIAKQRCEYFIEKDGKCLGCKKNSFGIARCKTLCLTHYNTIVRDNKKRIKKVMDIPPDFSLIINNPPVSKNLCTIEMENLITNTTN